MVAESVSFDAAVEVLATVAGIITAPLPDNLDPAPALSDADIELNLSKVDHLVKKFSSPEFTKNRTPQECCAEVMAETFQLSPYTLSRSLRRTLAQQIQALGSIFLAEIYASRSGLTLKDRIDEFQRLLCDTSLPRDQRLDALKRLSNGATYVSASPIRPRPDNELPIIYIGTPITRLSQGEHDLMIEFAEHVARVVESVGLKADIPGRYIRPDKISTTNQHIRDRIADSSLAWSSGFIGVGTNIAGRGMGYAVRRMEDMGAPVLLLSDEAEAFARVYGATLARRRQQIHDSLGEAIDQVERFISDNRDQIDSRHNDLVATMNSLAQPVSRLSDRLQGVDPAVFERSRLVRPRALHLVEDPLHYVHAQSWEIRELARILGINTFELVRLQYGIDAEGKSLPRQRSHNRVRAHDAGVTPLAWQGFLAAKEIGEWTDAQAMAIMDEYMNGPATELITTRQARVSAPDWLEFYDERFA